MDTTLGVADRPVRSRGLRIAAICAVTVSALVVMAWLGTLHRSPGWSGPVAAFTFAVAVALSLKLAPSTDRVATGVVVFGGAVALVGSGLTRPRREVSTGFRGSGDVISRIDTWWPVLVAGIVIGLAAVLVSYARRHHTIEHAYAAALLVLSLSVGMAVVAVLMHDTVVGHWIEGRPVRRRGRLVLPPPRAPSDSAVQGAWLAAADHERAAISAFRNLAIRLHDVGAPIDLIERCQRAATDETRHARQCVRLAGVGSERMPLGTNAPASQQTRPARARSRRIELMRIAIESFADGVVNEGFAAARLQRSAASADAETARRLRGMARDERRHASLGADIVRWCLGQSGFLLEAALRATAKRVPVARPFPVGLRDVGPATLAASGLADPSTCASAWAETRTHAQTWLVHVAAGS